MARYYHVDSHPLDLYSSLDEALHYLSQGVAPYIPLSAGPDEDQQTLRVCLAPTVEQCITSIGLALGPATYTPIIVLEFELDPREVYHPTSRQVPDVAVTGEVWSLKKIVPVKSSVYWLTASSISWRRQRAKSGEYMLVCTELRYMNGEEKKRALYSSENVCGTQADMASLNRLKLDL